MGNTVFDPIGEGEPVTGSRLASSKSGGGGGRAHGHARRIDSRDRFHRVLALLRAGTESGRAGGGAGEGNRRGAEVRTALEDLSVLSVQPQSEARVRRGRTFRW